jgi:hypothetical protein
MRDELRPLFTKHYFVKGKATDELEIARKLAESKLHSQEAI